MRLHIFGSSLILLTVAFVMWVLPTLIIAGIDQRISLLESEDHLAPPEQKLLNDLRWRKAKCILDQTVVFNPIATTLLVSLLVLAIALIVFWLINIRLPFP